MITLSNLVPNKSFFKAYCVVGLEVKRIDYWRHVAHMSLAPRILLGNDLQEEPL